MEISAQNTDYQPISDIHRRIRSLPVNTFLHVIPACALTPHCATSFSVMWIAAMRQRRSSAALQTGAASRTEREKRGICELADNEMAATMGRPAKPARASKPPRKHPCSLYYTILHLS